jgi:curved DNA-binding protein CbpA
MPDTEKGYVNYFEALDLDPSAKPGDVRKAYRKKMKDLVFEIHHAQITEERRAHYLLEMAKLNAALCILRDNETRETYWREREEAMALEEEWRRAADTPESDALRRQFDAKIRHFLSHYVEEAMLDAGRDKECVEASGWDAAHARHASRILRHYRHGLFRDILERLPYHEVTPPRIDWEERRRTAAAILEEGSK